MCFQVKLLPKQGTCVPRKTKQTNQPFETTFRLQVKWLFRDYSGVDLVQQFRVSHEARKSNVFLGNTYEEFHMLFRVSKPIESTSNVSFVKKSIIFSPI